jgi:hypothetical protein
VVTNFDTTQARRAHHEQHRTLGPFSRRPQQRCELLHVTASAEEHPVLVSVERPQPRIWRAVIGPTDPTRRIHPPQRLNQPRVLPPIT